jgi:hypothetical protein
MDYRSNARACLGALAVSRNDVKTFIRAAGLVRAPGGCLWWEWRVDRAKCQCPHHGRIATSREPCSHNRAWDTGSDDDAQPSREHVGRKPWSQRWSIGSSERDTASAVQRNSGPSFIKWGFV